MHRRGLRDQSDSRKGSILQFARRRPGRFPYRETDLKMKCCKLLVGVLLLAAVFSVPAFAEISQQQSDTVPHLRAAVPAGTQTTGLPAQRGEAGIGAFARHGWQVSADQHD